jgi:hypothetical protein
VVPFTIALSERQTAVFVPFSLLDVLALARWAHRPGPESGVRYARASSPRPDPFPPPPPPPVPGRCSAASQVQGVWPTSRVRTSAAYVLRLPGASARPACPQAGAGSPGSRARRFPYVQGVSDGAGSLRVSRYRRVHSVGTPEWPPLARRGAPISRLDTAPHAPVNTSRVLRDACA